MPLAYPWGYTYVFYNPFDGPPARGSVAGCRTFTSIRVLQEDFARIIMADSSSKKSAGAPKVNVWDGPRSFAICLEKGIGCGPNNI